MYYEQKSHRDVAYVKGHCPLCDSEATLKFFAEEGSGCIFIIPWWSTKYYVTCGNCFNTFKISNEQMQRIKREIDTQNQINDGNLCPKCHNQIVPGARFCGTCGESLPIETSKKSPKGTSFWEIALVIIIVIIFVICGLLLFNGTCSSVKPSTSLYGDLGYSMNLIRHSCYTI